MIKTFVHPIGIAPGAFDASLETLAANRTWTVADGQIGRFDCNNGGSGRTLTLPAVGVSSGALLWFSNESGRHDDLLTVVDSAAAGVTTIPAGSSKVLYCTGAVWSVLPGRNGLRDLVRSRTASGNITLTTADQRTQIIDPGGSARDVTLPAEEDMTGDEFIIVNSADAAETITVKDDAGSTVLTVAQNFGARFYCTGLAWLSYRFAQT